MKKLNCIYLYYLLRIKKPIDLTLTTVMQAEIQITTPPKDENVKKKDDNDKKIKRLFGEFVQAPTHKGLERVMRRANRVIAGTVSIPPLIGHGNTKYSWLMTQFQVWKSVSATTPREEIISNFKDIVYHLKSISHLSRRGLLSYSDEERRMYSDVIQYYTGILGHVFLVSGDATSTAPVAPATSATSAVSPYPVAPATSATSAASPDPVAPATSATSAVSPDPVERPAPSAPIPIPVRLRTKPNVSVDVNTYSPEYAVEDGGWGGGRSSRFGGHSEWDIG
jgi:hypothetical protein